MAIDKNPIKICWYCKKEFDGDFGIKNLQIICPFCKRPQSSVFEKNSQAQIIRRSKAGIKKSKAEKSKADFKNK